MNPKEIIQAWYNKGFGDKDIQAVAAERRLICEACPFMQEMMKVNVCSKCHCPIAGKTFSPYNSCPEKKWLK